MPQRIMQTGVLRHAQPAAIVSPKVMLSLATQTGQTSRRGAVDNSLIGFPRLAGLKSVAGSHVVRSTPGRADSPGSDPACSLMRRFRSDDRNEWVADRQRDEIELPARPALQLGGRSAPKLTSTMAGFRRADTFIVSGYRVKYPHFGQVEHLAATPEAAAVRLADDSFHQSGTGRSRPAFFRADLI